MNRAPQPATAAAVLRELRRHRNPEQAAVLRRFFKTGPGEYGAGDEFWGLKVPQTRAVLARFRAVPLAVAGELLDSPVHEARFFAVAGLVRDYARGNTAARVAIFDFYLARTARINNWDLVDSSAPQIVGWWTSARRASWGATCRRAAAAACWAVWRHRRCSGIGASRWWPRLSTSGKAGWKIRSGWRNGCWTIPKI